MGTIDSLPLFNSWPLFDAEERIGGDRLAALAQLMRAPREALPAALAQDIGLWTCDLTRNNALTWSPQVYALFGLAPDEPLTRAAAVSCYALRSRTAMEALRAHAIHHRRGFTLDAMLRRHDGETRWMRLSAMPVIAEGKVVRLAGIKQDVTAEYDGPGWQGF